MFLRGFIQCLNPGKLSITVSFWYGLQRVSSPTWWIWSLVEIRSAAWVLWKRVSWLPRENTSVAGMFLCRYESYQLYVDEANSTGSSAWLQITGASSYWTHFSVGLGSTCCMYFMLKRSFCFDEFPYVHFESHELLSRLWTLLIGYVALHSRSTSS